MCVGKQTRTPVPQGAKREGVQKEHRAFMGGQAATARERVSIDGAMEDEGLRSGGAGGKGAHWLSFASIMR